MGDTLNKNRPKYTRWPATPGMARTNRDASCGMWCSTVCTAKTFLAMGKSEATRPPRRCVTHTSEGFPLQVDTPW